MKLQPRRDQVVGRIVIKRMRSLIVRPDETKNTTKFVLIDAVGPDAAAKGLKVGQVVVPLAMGNIFLDGGACFRPLLDEEKIAVIVNDVNLNDLLVQTDSAAKFVPFDDKEAAHSLGVELHRTDVEGHAA